MPRGMGRALYDSIPANIAKAQKVGFFMGQDREKVIAMIKKTIEDYVSVLKIGPPVTKTMIVLRKECV